MLKEKEQADKDNDERFHILLLKIKNMKFEKDQPYSFKKYVKTVGIFMKEETLQSSEVESSDSHRVRHMYKNTRK